VTSVLGNGGRGRGVILTRGIVGRRDAVQWIVLEVVACLFSVVFCGSIICWEREGVVGVIGMPSSVYA
jgi:hypothetical protein